jgi:hypothetical protein
LDSFGAENEELLFVFTFQVLAEWGGGLGLLFPPNALILIPSFEFATCIQNINTDLLELSPYPSMKIEDSP